MYALCVCICRCSQVKQKQRNGNFNEIKLNFERKNFAIIAIENGRLYCRDPRKKIQDKNEANERGSTSAIFARIVHLTNAL